MQILMMAGADVYLENNGENAAEFLCTNGGKIDVIVMDFNMPGLNGAETTRLIREQGHIAPIVGMTAGEGELIKAVWLEAGCDVFIPKTSDRQTLVATIENSVSPVSS